MLFLLLLHGLAEGQATVRPLRLRPRLAKPPLSEISAGYDPRRIQVKFQDDLDIQLDSSGVPFDRRRRALLDPAARPLLGSISLAGGSWRRNTGADEATLDRMRATAQQNLGRVLADLNNYFLLDVPQENDAAEWMDALNHLPDVELAFPLPLLMPLSLAPPSPEAEPMPVSRPLPGDLREAQGYLNPAPEGIDAEFLWSVAGGAGANVRIVDLEFSWNLDHLDLPAVVPIVPGGEGDDTNHGTAVLGVLASVNNTFGSTGASFGAEVSVASAYGIEIGLNEAFQFAVEELSAGDVVLIEVGMPGPNFAGGSSQEVPLEWDPCIYDSIVMAVGNGIHVVEGAGNGAEDLDDPIYDVGHRPFLLANDSGAILVGAGGAPAAFGSLTPDRSRMSFSNHGARVDLQGWGTQVTTTGYGDLYSAEGENLYYTARFNGTSSASAIVASAVALLESFHEAHFGTVLTPAEMRALLVRTGSPQMDGLFPASEHIGPRPDLRAAVCTLDTAAPSLACPADITVDATERGGTPASDPAVSAFLGGFSVSDDIDPDPGVVSDSPAFFPIGSTPVTFTATDACGNSTSCQGTVNVVDRTPPVLSIALSRVTLWPPNRKLASIKVAVRVTDTCDQNPTFRLESIRCDEPDASTEKGDLSGDVQDAALGTPDLVFSLRSERMSHGDGRTYTITYSVSDSCGNRAESSATVVVPHDRGR